MGRTHQRLLVLLEAEGFTGIRVEPMKGHWRSSPYADVHRWEGAAVRDGLRVGVYSWETMTDCVRNGIVVSARDKGCSGNGYEVSAKVRQRRVPSPGSRGAT